MQDRSHRLDLDLGCLRTTLDKHTDITPRLQVPLNALIFHFDININYFQNLHSTPTNKDILAAQCLAGSRF